MDDPPKNVSYGVARRAVDGDNITTSRLTFFDLPPEIKDKIYEMYFENNYICINHSKAPSMYRSDTSGVVTNHWGWDIAKHRMTRQDLWSLFLVSRALYDGALRACLRKSTIVFKGFSQFSKALCDGKIPCFSTYLQDLCRSNPKPFLMVRHLWLDFVASRVQFNAVQTDTFFEVAATKLVMLKTLKVVFDSQSDIFIEVSVSESMIKGYMPCLSGWLLRVCCYFKHLQVLRIAYAKLDGGIGVRDGELYRAIYGVRKIQRQFELSMLNLALMDIPAYMEELAMRSKNSNRTYGFVTLELGILIKQELLKRWSDIYTQVNKDHMLKILHHEEQELQDMKKCMVKRYRRFRQYG